MHKYMHKFKNMRASDNYKINIAIRNTYSEYADNK